MTMVSIGFPFYMTKPADISEGGIALLNDSSFDIVYYIDKASNYDLEVWRRGELRYGVFEKDKIPFFLLDFVQKTWSADFSFNFLAERKRPEVFSNFLDNKGNAITFILVDAKTNVVLSLRMVGIKYSVMDQIKKACREQVEAYSSEDEVSRRITALMDEYSTREMIGGARMCLTTETEDAG